MSLFRRSAAEFVGTCWLVLCGCGSAVIAAHFQGAGVGLLGVAFAFGLSVLTMAYALGRVSGAHFNPAVTVGLWTARRFPASEIAAYVVAQVAGAILGAVILYLIARGSPDFRLDAGLGANGFGAHSPGGYALSSALLAEVVLTFAFLLVILGATDARAPQGFAPIAIGLALTLIHIVAIPITGTSVNPARSTGPAVLVGGWAIGQLWLFWLAPLVGGALAGLVYPAISGQHVEESASAESAGVHPERRPG